MPNKQKSNQPEPSLRGSEIHLALLAWKNGDISMIELKKVLKADIEAAEGVSILLKSDLAWCLGKLRGLGHPSEMLEARHGLTHPQAGEGEGK